MEFIRTVHPSHYVKHRKRFASLAFKNSSDGSGISVISSSCIERKTKSICKHIRKYYPSIAGTPIIFWKIDSNTPPTCCNFVQSPSTTGDECHYNIENLSDKEARKIIRNQPPSSFYICGNHKVVSFDESLLP